MTNLIKMEWYKLRTTKLFIVLLSVTTGLNLLIAAAIPILEKLFSATHTVTPAMASETVSSPFVFSLLLIPVFISAVSFLYSDFTGGFVKNIAGQLENRGTMVFAKFIVLCVHNLIFFIAGAASSLLGVVIGGQLIFDGAMLGGVMTLLLNWLLSMALCSIIMFFAVGIRNKTLASIIAVVFATNTLSLLYMAVNAGVMNLFKIEGFSIGHYLPDALIGTVNVINNTLVVNAVIVSAVFIAAFVTLTYVTFKKRDVK